MTMSATYIHPLSDVQTPHIGARTNIWQYVVALPGARIGDDCNICSHCFIENDVVVGNGVTIKNGVQLWNGLRIANDVFIGPNVSFANDRFPRSKRFLESALVTHIESGASIGAGASILPGIRIGKKAMIGAGAVVTRSVPANAIVVGNPARIIGYIDTSGYAAHSVRIMDTPGIQESKACGVKLYKLNTVTDIRGSLTVGEFEKTIPFGVKRYFIVFDVPNAETRGEHAHRECHQFMVCIHGSVAIVVDDGHNREEFMLNHSSFGLYIPPMVWGIQYKYSPDARLLVFASHHYEPSDYIRDYDEFLAIVRKTK